MLRNCILLWDEITPIDGGMSRGSSLGLHPCHLVCSVACPVFILRFLFQFVLFFLSLLVINFRFLEPLLFYAPLSWLYVDLVLYALLFFFSTSFSACPQFGLFTISYFPPDISYPFFSCSSRYLLISISFVSLFFIFHFPFLFFLPLVHSLSTNPYHIHPSCYFLSYSWRLGTNSVHYEALQIGAGGGGGGSKSESPCFYSVKYYF